jgi:hypothetical protein
MLEIDLASLLLSNCYCSSLVFISFLLFHLNIQFIHVAERKAGSINDKEILNGRKNIQHTVSFF